MGYALIVAGNRDDRVDAAVTDAEADSVLAASRALVALSAESMNAVADVLDVTHFRLMVVIAGRHGTSLGEASEAAHIHVSRASRICDQLVAERLVSRSEDPGDRRHVVLKATVKGRRLVDRVMDRRRAAARRVLGRLRAGERKQILDALTMFADAAGEAPYELLLSMGWTT